MGYSPSPFGVVRRVPPNASKLVATALRRKEQTRVIQNGLRLGTDARNGVAHAPFDRGVAASGGPVSGVRSAMRRAGGPRGVERHQDVGFGLPHSRIGKGATGL